MPDYHNILVKTFQAKAEKEFKQAKKAFKAGKSQAEKANLEKKRKALERAMEQLDKLNTQVRRFTGICIGCVIPRLQTEELLWVNVISCLCSVHRKADSRGSNATLTGSITHPISSSVCKLCDLASWLGM